MPPSYLKKKKRSLGSILRETALIRRFRASETHAVFDYDWSMIHYNRAAVVSLLLAQDRNEDYLEIGCASNLLFDTVAAPLKVGVDPAQGGTHRMTSDAFFAQNQDRFDVVFIDGLHVYDQVRRDLEGALKAVRPGGWIALHDMLPRDWIEEHVPQISTSRWTGDGWKLAFELIATPGVDFRLIAIDHGVAVIKVLSEAPVLTDRRADLADKRFIYFHRHVAELPVVDWAEARRWVLSYRS